MGRLTLGAEVVTVNPEVDWTFDVIPSESEFANPLPSAVQPVRQAAAPAAQPAAVRPRWRRPALLLGGAALVIISIYLVYWFGWQRVRLQVAGEVAYEDAQSLAANVEAVTAVLAEDDPAWVAQRLAEVRLGYPARLPADNLLPAGAPPRLLALDSTESGVIAVTVTRRFVDSTGQAYEFEYDQRYRRGRPGQWTRLPPDTRALTETTTWQGQRVRAALPAADREWLEQVLPQVDAYLVQACADWHCPAGLVAPVVFTGQPDMLPSSTAARRPGDSAQSAGYPLIFDMAFDNPRYPQRVVLPSLQLSGRPHDGRAAGALVRATTAKLLGYLASQIAGVPRTSTADYLDALVARQEVRLGLAAQPEWQVSVSGYVPPGDLWPFLRGGARAARPEVELRLEALAFVNYALADPGAPAEARLLASLRHQPSLEAWLTESAGLDGAALIAGWQQAQTQQLLARYPPRWPSLEGLAYSCVSGAWLVRAEQARRLPVDGHYAWLLPGALSPDGTRLAVTVAGYGSAELKIINLADNSTRLVSSGRDWPLGWSGEGRLVYLQARPNQTSIKEAFQLTLFNPHTGDRHALSQHTVLPPWRGEQSWSADHNQLALTLIDADRGLQPVPAVLSLAHQFQMLKLDIEGHSGAISPDGRFLAYVVGHLPWQATPDAMTPRVEIIDLQTHQAYAVLAPDGTSQAEFEDLYSLTWAADGRSLAFLDDRAASGTHLFQLRFDNTVATQGGTLFELGLFAGDVSHLALAADGRFASLLRIQSDRNQVVVVDLADGGEQVFPTLGETAAWSPTGHQLAVGGPAGLYVVDALSGEQQWITDSSCVPAWYALP